MNRATLTRRFSAVLVASSLAACVDSTAPLTDEQLTEMLEAMSNVLMLGVPVGTLTDVTVSEFIECPSGGGISVDGTVNDDAVGTAAVEVTQWLIGCKATSSNGRLWTFDSDPGKNRIIVTALTVNYDATTGTFNASGTQTGGTGLSSDLGRRTCDISLAISVSGDASSFDGTLTGTACGRAVQQAIVVTP